MTSLRLCVSRWAWTGRMRHEQGVHDVAWHTDWSVCGHDRGQCVHPVDIMAIKESLAGFGGGTGGMVWCDYMYTSALVYNFFKKR